MLANALARQDADGAGAGDAVAGCAGEGRELGGEGEGVAGEDESEVDDAGMCAGGGGVGVCGAVGATTLAERGGQVSRIWGEGLGIGRWGWGSCRLFYAGLRVGMAAGYADSKAVRWDTCEMDSVGSI